MMLWCVCCATVVCIQFGFVAIFAVAYPLGAAFALLNNVLELRFDGHVLLTMTRRPRYSDSESIGAWMSVLQCSASCFTAHTHCSMSLRQFLVVRQGADG
jgi:hypothetical protein|eukprot:COSAG02_NODE_308_length_25072_cov_20.906925_7_plen_100_part_00